MLTNSPNSFQNSCAIDTGLSDFHKITATILKTKFEKLKYRDYKTKNFSNDKFREYLLSKLPMENTGPFEQDFQHGFSWWGTF